jgi:hypothetical protein
MEKKDTMVAPSIAVTAGDSGAIARTMQAAPPTATAAAPSRTLPKFVMITGGVAVVTGLVLIAVDENPKQEAGMPQQKYYRETLLGGSIAVAAGAVTLGIGYLWWRSTAPPSRIAPSVTPASVGTGAVLSLTGSF